MRNRLVELTVQLGGAYGTTSKIFKNVAHAQSRLDELRSDLDSAVFKEHPYRDREDKLDCYYPLQESRRAEGP